MVVSSFGTAKEFDIQGDQLLRMFHNKSGRVEVGGTAASTGDRSGQMRAKSGYLSGIFGRFGALTGAPGVTYG